MKNLATTVSKSHHPVLSRALGVLVFFFQFIGALSMTRSRYRLRPISESDGPAVKNLIQKILLERGGIGIESLYYDRELDHLHDIYRCKGHLLDVLTYGNEVVGTVGFGPASKEQYDASEVCEIKKLYLHRDYRNQGQGRMMFDKAIKQARKMGYKKCLVSIERRNKQFFDFLAANDFMFSGGSMQGDTSHEVYMIKELN